MNMRLLTNNLASFQFHSKTYYNSTTNRKRNSNITVNLNAGRYPISEIENCNDVIIVGAGVAGSALAHTLAMDGRRVHVIEKNMSEPNRITGEVLQPAGHLKLLELGLEDCVTGIDAQPMLGYAFYLDGKWVKITYPKEIYGNDGIGRTFHNGRFVQKLRHKAASLKNVKLEQGIVTSLVEERGEIKGVQYRNDNGHEMTAYAPLTVVSDGGFSSLRKFLSKPKIKRPSSSVCVVMENCLPHPNYGHLILGKPSAIAFYSLSSTEVRCYIDVPGPKLPSISNGKMKEFLKTVVAQQVPNELLDAFISSVNKGEYRTMPISSMPAAPIITPGALLLGDSLNMRNSLSGGGMSVALQDVALLSKLLQHLNFEDTTALTKQIRNFYKLRKASAFTINVISDSIHKAHCSYPSESIRKFQPAYLSYLTLGDFTKRGQAGLFSGLSPNPWISLLNVLAPFIYALGAAMSSPISSATQLYGGAVIVMDVAKGIISIFLDEDIRDVFFSAQAFGRQKK